MVAACETTSSRPSMQTNCYASIYACCMMMQTHKKTCGLRLLQQVVIATLFFVHASTDMSLEDRKCELIAGLID